MSTAKLIRIFTGQKSIEELRGEEDSLTLDPAAFETALRYGWAKDLSILPEKRYVAGLMVCTLKGASYRGTSVKEALKNFTYRGKTQNVPVYLVPEPKNMYGTGYTISVFGELQGKFTHIGYVAAPAARSWASLWPRDVNGDRMVIKALLDRHMTIEFTKP